ncbi:hypothetical protein ACLOJK_001566, partial [Asimina triloba]
MPQGTGNPYPVRGQIGEEEEEEEEEMDLAAAVEGKAAVENPLQPPDLLRSAWHPCTQ